MKVYILNNSYERIAYIDHADSILWDKKYNDIGECEIYLPCSIDMLNILQKGFYVYREDDEMICKIETIQIETDVEKGDYIIATAKDMNNILANRIVRNGFTYSGSVASFIKKLVVDNIITPEQTKRAFTNFTFNDSNFSDFTETININVTSGEDILELIKTTCKTFNYGFRVKYIELIKTLEFTLKKGKNKAMSTGVEYVEFSPTYSNILSSNYKEDESNYKNVCYVSYKDSNEEIQLLLVFNTETEPAAEERKEVFVDATGLSREIKIEELELMFPYTLRLEGTTYYSNEKVVASVSGDKIVVSDYTYSILLRTLGLNTLAERVKTQEFTGSVDIIDTYQYKVDYDLGDIVKVINEYGIGAEARITEIMESDDNENGYSIEPKFEYIN